MLDYDAAGNLVGIDIDPASKKVDLEKLILSSLPGEVQTIAAPELAIGPRGPPGLDTMPMVEAELNARDLRRFTNEFLGKSAELTASGQHSALASPAAVNARSVSRAKILRSPLVVLFSVVALAGTIAAGALHESDKRAALPAPPPAVVPAPVAPPPVQSAELPPPEPVVLVNPFDKTEKFTFPPGTSKADARDQMAALLLERAVARRAHVPRARKLAAEPRAQDRPRLVAAYLILSPSFRT